MTDAHAASAGFYWLVVFATISWFAYFDGSFMPGVALFYALLWTTAAGWLLLHSAFGLF